MIFPETLKVALKALPRGAAELGWKNLLVASVVKNTGHCLLHACYLPGSVQFSSVTQSCLTLCDPMDCSMPGFPVHHQLPELTQTHVHRVGDAIQPSHLLLSPSPPTTFNLSKTLQSGSFPMSGFFPSDGQSIGVSASAPVLPINIQD